MEVTKKNFQELLPDIEKTIDEAHFLCVDGEFTGLNYENNINSFDIPSQYYGKLKNGAMDFLFVQFGLGAFQYDFELERYSSKAYNFYIFPKPLNRHAPDRRFVCQSSSLDFLASNGFDFNKLFNDGIPYLNGKEEENVKMNMMERRKYNKSQISALSIPIPNHLKSQVMSACDKIGELLEEGSTKEEVIIEKCNAFIRKLIYQTVGERYGGNIDVETKQGVMIAKKGTGLTVEEKEKEAEEKELKEVDQAVGFSKVIRKIISSRKIVVGHNMLIDLCHIVHHFCHPLPDNYLDFKDLIHNLFPNVVDTKLMCSFSPLKDLIPCSILENILQGVAAEPFNKIDIEATEGYSYKEEVSPKYHQAGYDAYITGVCFLSLFTYLQSENGEDVKQLPEDSTILKSYLNRLYLMKTPDTHIHLGDKDPDPNRDHVFHVTFPKHWTNGNITELFSPYGGVQINWCNDNSAWASLFDRKEYMRAIRGLVKGSTPKEVKVRHYSQMVDQGLPGATKRSALPSPDLPKHPKRRFTQLKRTFETIPEETQEVRAGGFIELETGVNSGNETFAVDQVW